METVPKEGLMQTVLSPKSYLATHTPNHHPSTTHFTERGRSGVLSIAEQEKAVLRN